MSEVHMTTQAPQRKADGPELIYIHDPMCSWCWGFRPTFERLCARLPPATSVRRLLGGLAPDNDQPMPAAMRAKLEQTWHRIQQHIPGTRFNFDFWRDCQPRRSTWPACRAVIAARRLDSSQEVAMIGAIQQAYYLEARNPSDRDTLTALAEGIGLEGGAFADLLDAPQTQAVLVREIAEARRLGADSFPSLRLHLGASHWPVPVHYTEVGPMLETIEALLGT